MRGSRRAPGHAVARWAHGPAQAAQDRRRGGRAVAGAPAGSRRRERALLAAAAREWDEQAPQFDGAADHGLRNPVTRAAWRSRLRAWLPATPAGVLDLGCGTGSLSLLMAADGHRVTAVDLSGAMLTEARRKLDGSTAGVALARMEASSPGFRAGSFDAVVARHLVWALVDPPRALRSWIELLAPAGRIVLIEGRWAPSGSALRDEGRPRERLPWHGGVTARELAAALEPHVAGLRVEQLEEDDRLWGRAVSDERYALIGDLAPATRAPAGE